jgi:hypothetical protein
MKWISIASLIAIVIGGGAALSSPPATMPGTALSKAELSSKNDSQV